MGGEPNEWGRYTTRGQFLSTLPNLHAGGRLYETERRVLRMGVHEPDGDRDIVLVAFVKNRDRSYARGNTNEGG